MFETNCLETIKFKDGKKISFIYFIALFKLLLKLLMDYLSLEHNYEEVPARQIDRRCTDVFCTLFTSAFAITLFVFATLAFIRNSNYFDTQ